MSAHDLSADYVIVGAGSSGAAVAARLSEDPALSAHFDQLKQRHGLGRFGQPAEIGESVKWLLSDNASFVNGSALQVDGGFLSI